MKVKTPEGDAEWKNIEVTVYVRCLPQRPYVDMFYDISLCPPNENCSNKRILL
jgi:hypothetical protein